MELDCELSEPASPSRTVSRLPILRTTAACWPERDEDAATGAATAMAIATAVAPGACSLEHHRDQPSLFTTSGLDTAYKLLCSFNLQKMDSQKRVAGLCGACCQVAHGQFWLWLTSSPGWIYAIYGLCMSISWATNVANIDKYRVSIRSCLRGRRTKKKKNINVCFAINSQEFLVVFS
jgi:hypothetical protein